MSKLNKILVLIFSTFLIAFGLLLIPNRANSASFCVSVSEISPEQCDALVSIYETTDGQNWLKNTNWLVSNTPCNWHGVTCENGQVMQLNLGKNNLSGTIPSALANLTSVQTITLSSNHLTGTVPVAMGYMTKLKYLSMEKNSLAGKLPDSLANLDRPVTLKVSYNKLLITDTSMITTPDWQTQTVPPTNLKVIPQSNSSVLLTWTPISYTTDGGYYEISYGYSANNFQFAQFTAHKAISSYLVTGLLTNTTYSFRLRTFTPAHADQFNALWSDYTPIVSTTTFLTILDVDPTVLNFSGIEGTSPPLTHTIVISNKGNGILNWSAQENSTWLTITPTSGIEPGIITVTADIGGLANGDYSSLITVASHGGTQIISTNLKVISNPVLAVNPSNFDFLGYEAGAPPPKQTFYINNSGTGLLYWFATESISWLSLSNNIGTAPSPVDLLIDTTGLAVGIYTGSVNIISSGGSQTFTATLTITANPILALSQDTVEFVTIEGNNYPPDQKVNILNNGTGILRWQAVETATWLTMSPEVYADRLNISVSAVGLPAGVYSSPIQITSNGGEKTITVTFHVRHDPMLFVDAQALSFNAIEGGNNPVMQSFVISNTGTGTLNWFVRTSATWLTMSPLSGNAPITVAVSADISKLTTGVYTGYIVVDGGLARSSPQTVTVNLTIRPEPTPTPTFTPTLSPTPTPTPTSTPTSPIPPTFTPTPTATPTSPLIPNTPPLVRDLMIQPTVPNESDDLVLVYDYFDADGQPQDKDLSQIHWTLNGQAQPSLDNLTVIPSGLTQVDQSWCAEVIPHDGLNFGEIAGPVCVAIATPGNTPPQARRLVITPAKPTDAQNLHLSYEYYDVYGRERTSDNLTGTQIRWYLKHGGGYTLQPALNDRRIVSDYYTQPGETWCVTVRPYDGINFGTITGPICVTILDQQGQITVLPQIIAVGIIPPAKPITGLRVSYLTNFEETALNSHIETRWYRNEMLQPAFNNQAGIPADELFAGDRWRVTVQPHNEDGIGTTVRSSEVVVANDDSQIVPKIIMAFINPFMPTSADDLILTYTANLSLSNQTRIKWYRGETTDSEYDLQPGITQSVSSDLTFIGECWYVQITPHDGNIYGSTYRTSRSCIGSGNVNAQPVARNIRITPLNPGEDDMLSLHYDYIDPENNPEGDSSIEWQYWDGQSWQPDNLHSGVTEIPSNYTYVGDKWRAYVIPRDNVGERDTEKAYWSNEVLIQQGSRLNTRPEATDVRITPGNPKHGDALNLSYIYSDLDGDIEGSTSITWTSEGKELRELSGSTIAGTSVSDDKEQEWCVSVVPHDGIEFGNLAGPSCVVINDQQRNSPPEAHNVSLGPDIPLVSTSLRLYYDYVDADNDPETNSSIHWFLQRYETNYIEHRSDFDGLTVIPPTHLADGDRWQAKLLVHDGRDYGLEEITTKWATIKRPPDTVFLPVILKIPEGQPPITPTPPTPTPTPAVSPNCNPANGYEDNDTKSNACKLIPDTIYVAAPNDKHDMFYFTLSQTSDVTVLIKDYQADEGEINIRDDNGYIYNEMGGQVYQLIGKKHSLVATLQIKLPAGKYYVQVYTREPYVSEAYRLVVSY